MHKQGDIIDDCPSCSKVKSIQYRGPNEEGISEAVCLGCGEIFEIVDENKEPAPTPPAPAPLAPAPAPAPTNPKLTKAYSDLKKLTPVPETNDPKAAFKLSQDGVDDFTNGGSDIPAYIRHSRAWRWAQKMGKIGNPYREGSKNNEIFAIYAEEPRTVEVCVIECAKRGYNEKLSYLLTIYEVTAHCLSSGLLVMDPETRVITPCQGKPVPIRVT